ncbi:hypothetical protein [Streptomyces sp. NBC_01537]|uniref:hypothetical protein n=1 Tax=Streptomyces sp. NBC_01537 TaxID=2903896 RepID=UPI00386BB6E9
MPWHQRSRRFRGVGEPWYQPAGLFAAVGGTCTVPSDASPSRGTGVSTPMAGIRSLTGTERARVRGDAGVPLVRTAQVGVVVGVVAEARAVA